MRVGERQSAIYQAVEVRRIDDPITERGDGVKALLIYHQEQNIWLLWQLFERRRCKARCRGREHGRCPGQHLQSGSSIYVGHYASSYVLSSFALINPPTTAYYWNLWFYRRRSHLLTNKISSDIRAPPSGPLRFLGIRANWSRRKDRLIRIIISELCGDDFTRRDTMLDPLH